jgi:putative tricarboxylic transport membrane protein
MASALLFVGAGSWLLVRPGAATVWASRPVLGKMAAAVAAFGAYAALLEPLGFVVATSATLAAISTLFGGPWRKSLGSATALSVVLWYLFVWVLALPLPLGLVWEALWMP